MEEKKYELSIKSAEVDKHKTTIIGTEVDILNALATLVKELKETASIPEDMIRLVVEVGLEETEKSKQNNDSIEDAIDELLKKILS